MRRTRIGYAYWGLAEYRAVFEGWAGFADDAPAKLGKALSALGYGDALVLTNRATTGLEVALATMRDRQPGRGKVLVPAFCCPAVPRAVIGLGLEPVPIPIGDDLNLDLTRTAAMLDRDVLAVVGVHMFASPLDIAALSALARPHGAMVVDDAAHTLGDSLGTGGDVGLLSFNQSKTLAGGTPNGGGALVITNRELAGPIDARMAALAAPSRLLRQSLWFTFAYAIDPLPRRLPNYAAKTFKKIARWAGAGERGRSRIGPIAAAVLLAQLRRLERIRERRTALLAMYAREAEAGGVFRMVQYEPDAYRTRMIIAWTGGRSAAATQPRLTAAGISSRRLYTPWSHAAAVELGDRLDRHLELPGDLRMTGRDVEKLMKALRAIVFG